MVQLTTMFLQVKYVDHMEQDQVKECWHQNVTQCHDTYITEFLPRCNVTSPYVTPCHLISRYVMKHNCLVSAKSKSARKVSGSHVK